MELPDYLALVIRGGALWSLGVCLPGAFGEGLDLGVVAKSLQASCPLVIRHSPCFYHPDYKVDFPATAFCKRYSWPSAFSPSSRGQDGESHLYACRAELPTLGAY